MADDSLRVAWRTREPPLSATGVVARAAVAVRLARRLLAADDGDLGRWRGVCGPQLLALFADEPPWLDGVVLLGSEHGIWMPTTLAPSLPCAWLARALERAHGGSQWVVVPAASDAQPLVFSAQHARPCSRQQLSRWLVEHTP